MDMEQVIQTEIDRINAERAEHGKRKMRIDAVSAIEMIQKPPMEVMETLTREEQTEFHLRSRRNLLFYDTSRRRSVGLVSNHLYRK